ncbi:MAG: hypothetical protein WBV39_09775 [Rudaea sp.]
MRKQGISDFADSGELPWFDDRWGDDLIFEDRVGFFSASVGVVELSGSVARQCASGKIVPVCPGKVALPVLSHVMEGEDNAQVLDRNNCNVLDCCVGGCMSAAGTARFGWR